MFIARPVIGYLAVRTGGPKHAAIDIVEFRPSELRDCGLLSDL
jgi:hypothetical protein